MRVLAARLASAAGLSYTVEQWIADQPVTMRVEGANIEAIDSLLRRQRLGLVRDRYDPTYLRFKSEADQGVEARSYETTRLDASPHPSTAAAHLCFFGLPADRLVVLAPEAGLLVRHPAGVDAEGYEAELEQLSAGVMRIAEMLPGETLRLNPAQRGRRVGQAIRLYGDWDAFACRGRPYEVVDTRGGLSPRTSNLAPASSVVCDPSEDPWRCDVVAMNAPIDELALSLGRALGKDVWVEPGLHGRALDMSGSGIEWRRIFRAIRYTTDVRVDIAEGVLLFEDAESFMRRAARTTEGLAVDGMLGRTPRGAERAVAKLLCREALSPDGYAVIVAPSVVAVYDTEVSLKQAANWITVLGSER